MDSLRGKNGFSDGTDGSDPWNSGWDDGEEAGDAALSYDESPPAPVAQDERRMQVRAYNYWAALLGERNFPCVEDIDPDGMPDFAPKSVLLDFTGGMENPAIAFLGNALASECGSKDEIATLADVPPGSLLSRITDHYMQILSNEAPIGFEAEFSNQQGITILYRGILLPFSTDNETIDFIYGVINWKEVADQLTTDELLLEIDQALERRPDEREEDHAHLQERRRKALAPSITRWADGPNAAEDSDTGSDVVDEYTTLPGPTFAQLDSGPGKVTNPVDDDAGARASLDSPAVLHMSTAGGVHACLAQARALAEAAHGARVRSRTALYHAVSRAYDLSLAAQAEREEFIALLESEGIDSVPRAPMTPVVKLVFGVDYDKSRVAEYAAVLSFAHRQRIGAGDLAAFLEHAEGGLKGVVSSERAARQGEEPARATISGEATRVYRELSQIDGKPLASIPETGAEFSLCVIRRGKKGEIAFLGEVAEDERLLARAAKQLVG